MAGQLEKCILRPHLWALIPMQAKLSICGPKSLYFTSLCASDLAQHWLPAPGPWVVYILTIRKLHAFAYLVKILNDLNYSQSLNYATKGVKRRKK
jgi:hypothetical protein